MIYIAYFDDGSNYSVAGVFDNKADAQACVNTFTERHAYVQQYQLNKQYVVPNGRELSFPLAE